jgi:hypothetical protein
VCDDRIELTALPAAPIVFADGFPSGIKRECGARVTPMPQLSPQL